MNGCKPAARNRGGQATHSGCFSANLAGITWYAKIDRLIVPEGEPHENRRTPRPSQAHPPTAPQRQPAGAGAPAQTEEAPVTKLPPLAERTLADILDLLCRPLHLQHIELKPGVLSGDKTRALALPYVDSRIYQKHLDYLTGLEGWRAEFVVWVRPGSSAASPSSASRRRPPARATPTIPTAARSPRRRCSSACSAFGCGRYLYDLPQRWFDYDDQKKRFADPLGAAREIEWQAGLIE